MAPEKITPEQVAAAADKHRQAEAVAKELWNAWRDIQTAFHQQELAAKGIVPMETICVVTGYGWNSWDKIRCMVQPNNNGKITCFPVTKGNKIAKNRNRFSVQIEKIEPEATA